MDVPWYFPTMVPFKAPWMGDVRLVTGQGELLPIANPMSVHPPYKRFRKTWGINAMGSDLGARVFGWMTYVIISLN